jgi:hypothetical protein
MLGRASGYRRGARVVDREGLGSKDHQRVDKASGITGTTVNLTMGSVDD